MQPIQTHYNGYHFRSRLEARVAIFLDNIGWKWRYELEGFEFSDGTRYLPDFLVIDPTTGAGLFYIEVKGQNPTPDDLHKAAELCTDSKLPVVFIVGEIDARKICGGLLGYVSNEEVGYHEMNFSISYYCWNKWGEPGYWVEDDPCDKTISACIAARSARFEHGQSGAL